MAASERDSFYHMFFLDNMDSPDNTPMDTRVWSRMPLDVLEKILLRLPLAVQAKFRVVSKAARWVLSSERFQRVRSDSMSSAGFGRSSELQVTYKEHKLSLGFLPPEFRVLDANGGIQCCRHHFGKGVLFLVREICHPNGRRVGHKICVVNPFNQTWRQLPDLIVKSISRMRPDFDPLDEVSLMGEEEGAFQVFVLHTFTYTDRSNDPMYAYVSIYSSRTNEWKRKFNTYENPNSQIMLADATLAVGQEYVYALRQDPRRASDTLAELFRARNGKHVRSLAPPHYTVEIFLLGLVQLEQGEHMLAVPMNGGHCKILRLPAHDAEGWEKAASLPRDLAMEMAPDHEEDFDDLDDNSSEDGSHFLPGLHNFRTKKPCLLWRIFRLQAHVWLFLCR